MINCPVCGSDKVTHTSRTKVVKMPYAAPVEYSSHRDACADCGMVADFHNINASLIKAAIKQAQIEELGNLLKLIEAHNEPNFYLALGLNPMVIPKWKKDGPTVEGLALLRLLAEDPKLLGKAKMMKIFYKKPELTVV